MIALTWADIDDARCVIQVNKASRGGARDKATKTEAGYREVKLLAPAITALNRQKQHTRLLHREIFLNPGTLISNRPHGGAVVHTGQRRPTTVNTRWQEKAIRNHFKAACKAAGVRYRFPRQLRHTYASWMLSGREDPVWISRQMGHSHVGITLKTYTRYVHDLNLSAGSAAVAAILGDHPSDKR